MTYFTSDTHFGHANIIEYCGRPFANAEDMDRTMVERWNARVTPDDEVWHLGDFAFGPVESIARALVHLHGRVHLVRGNHDRSTKRMREFGFFTTQETAMLQLGGFKLLLTHKPSARALGWPGVDYHLHGHVHEKYARRGLVLAGYVRPSRPGDLDEQHAWLKRNQWFGIDRESEP